MTDDQNQGRSFGELAEVFDRIRPGYPDALITDVLDYSAATEAVEVGAGTGKATTAFSARGVQVTAVEPDAKMADLLRQRLQGRTNVHIVPSTFEEFSPTRQYGLLICAQAWQWTDPARRWQLAARALAPSGALALFWNYDWIADAALRAEVASVHAALAPHVLFDDEVDSQTPLAQLWPGDELAGLSDFTDLADHAYLWERTLEADEYLAYLSTQPTYRLLGAHRMEELFAAVAQVLPEKVALAVETVLYLARRAD